MYPSYHIAVGILFSLTCFIFFPSIGIGNASLIFFSSVLIDVDHYLYYVFRKKDLSLKNAYVWFNQKLDRFLSFPRQKRNNTYLGFCCLHGIEMLILLLVFSFFLKSLFFIFIGFSLHLLFDFFSESFSIDRIDKFSIIKDFFKFRKLEHIENVEKE